MPFHPWNVPVLENHSTTAPSPEATATTARAVARNAAVVHCEPPAMTASATTSAMSSWTAGSGASSAGPQAQDAAVQHALLGQGRRGVQRARRPRR